MSVQYNHDVLFAPTPIVGGRAATFRGYADVFMTNH
jgi:hypothetical protein